MDKRYLINYLRLSKGDVERRDESNSITNQRRIQDEYIKNHIQLQTYARLEFVDDGYSGTNFERPGICKVLELVRGGKAACIIVKDLSRFGREYIDSGKYIERLFPGITWNIFFPPWGYGLLPSMISLTLMISKMRFRELKLRLKTS